MTPIEPRIETPNPPWESYRVIRQVFVRGIGIIYFIAVVSLWTQIQGLVGSHGLLPIQQYLDLVRQFLPHGRFLQNPSLVWLNPSDGFLNFLCAAGAALSLVVVAGFVQAPALALLWVIYLSLTVAGQDFLNFQWDALLLEAGLLTIFFAPTQFVPRLSRQREPSRIVLWLLRWLLFRLMFLSGLVKLLSGDSSWRDGTALNYHYLTQPLPAWTSYWAYQLPGWFQWFSVWLMFGIELLSPFFIFLGDLVDAGGNWLHRQSGAVRKNGFGRRSRQAAFVFLNSLQLLITATGNFGFFNLLAMLLCVTLLDDSVVPKWLRERAGAVATDSVSYAAAISARDIPPPVATRDWLDRVRLIATSAFAVTIIFLTTLTGVLECMRTVNYQASLPQALQTVVDWVEPFRSTNGYGLFRVMTRERNEIIIEGSDDRMNWKPYEFKYKPGDVVRMPRFCTPNMPRLDWQMWFCVFGRADQNRWFIPLLKRLLAGEPHVLGLLGKNPFSDHPPRYIRATEYNYRFAPVSAKGRWWDRSDPESYFPPVTLEEMQQAYPEPGVDGP